MYEELREQAQKKVQAKTSFYILTVIFSSTIIVLLMLSFYLSGISFWLRLPIPLLLMIWGVIYISTFGYSAKGLPNEDWKEAEIEKELIKIYKRKKAELPPLEDLSETEILELRALEQIIQQQEGTDDLV